MKNTNATNAKIEFLNSNKEKVVAFIENLDMSECIELFEDKGRMFKKLPLNSKISVFFESFDLDEIKGFIG